MDEQKRKEIDLAWEQHNSVETLWLKKKEIRETLSERQNHRCCFCQCKFEDTGYRRATIEHVVPKALNGKDEEVNLVASCFRCNSNRGDTLYWPLSRDYSSDFYRVYDDSELRE